MVFSELLSRGRFLWYVSKPQFFHKMSQVPLEEGLVACCSCFAEVRLIGHVENPVFLFHQLVYSSAQSLLDDLDAVLFGWIIADVEIVFDFLEFPVNVFEFDFVVEFGIDFVEQHHCHLSPGKVCYFSCSVSSQAFE